MRKFNRILVGFALAGWLVAAPLALSAAETTTLRIGIVNFRKAVEESKLGKQEQEQFDSMRRQLEGMLEDKESKLSELAEKLNDADYIDGLNPEAETDLKRDYRSLTQELSQLQGQYYQVLQQANVKIIQKLGDIIAEASQTVAESQELDLILNEDAAFFYSDNLEITNEVIASMDKIFDDRKPNEAASVESVDTNDKN